MNDLKLWLEARDIFLGINFKRGRNYCDAFKIAQKSKHPEAIWLCEYFKNLELPLFRIQAINMLPDDHVYKMFTYNHAHHIDHPFIKSYYGYSHKNDLNYEDHYAYYYKWFHSQKKDKKSLLISGHLGNVIAMVELRKVNDVWIIRSAVNNYCDYNHYFMDVLRKNVNSFLWGKELNNNLQNNFYIDNPNVKECQEYYRRCKKVMMDTIQIWSLYVIRFQRERINRDVRKLIIEYILLNDAEWG